MGNVLLGETVESEDDGENLPYSSEERVWRILSKETDLGSERAGKKTDSNDTFTS